MARHNLRNALILGTDYYVADADYQRCAEGIPRIIPILGIPWYSRDFQRGGRISGAAGFAYSVHAYKD